MKRALAVLALYTLAACSGGPKVVVRASLEDGGGQPIGDLPVRLLPYDRQAILDSLARENDSPEPRLPQDVLQRLHALTAEEAAARPKGDTAVRRVQAERRALLARADTVRRAREKWLASVQEDFEAGVKERTGTGTVERTDTTDAQGRAELPADAGKYWVVAQYVLPETVLEWNVPVRLTGDSAVVRLTRDKAREQPLLP